jgi:cytoskeletal protein CcmA (bactofilin family)
MAKEIVSNNGATIYSVIAAGTKINGSISTDNDIRLDGVLEGDLTCRGKVVTGLQSYLKGFVECINAEVLGKVDAKLKCSEVLTLRSQSVIEGEIETSTLIIEAGAVFNGTCSMKKE